MTTATAAIDYAPSDTTTATPDGSDLSRPTFIVVSLLVALLAAGTLVYSTRDGIGLSLDSDAYLTGATQMLAGQGFSQPSWEGPQPLTHFPPLYSVLLAGPIKAGLHPFEAARWLNIALAFGTVLMVALLLRRGVGLSRRAALLATLMTVVSSTLLFMHAMAWTEGLFIFLMLVTFWFLGQFLDRAKRRLLVFAGIAATLAVLTRYAGAALVITGGVVLLLCGRRTLKQRVLDIFVFGSVAGLPVLAWLVRNARSDPDGEAANRKLAWHPPSDALLESGMNSIAQWIWYAGTSIRMWGGFIAVVTLLVIALISARNARTEGRRSRAAGGTAGGAAAAIGWFVPIYVAFLLTSISLFDAATPLDDRILSPLFVAAAMAITMEFARSNLPAAAGRWAQRWPQLLAGAACVFVAFQAGRIAVWAYEAPKKHLGYGMRMWRESDLINYVKTIPPGLPVFSNGRAAIHLHTGRVVKPIPGKVELSTGQRYESIQSKIKLIERALINENGYLVYFTSIRHRTILRQDELKAEYNLRHVYAGGDGNVYRWKMDRTPKRKEAIAKAKARARRARHAAHAAAATQPALKRELGADIEMEPEPQSGPSP